MCESVSQKRVAAATLTPSGPPAAQPIDDSVFISSSLRFAGTV
jgi:hypothetical protein